MTDHRPRIVFMGTPEFAVASLEAIIKAGYSVVAVVTKPDKLSGRGQKLSKTAVKEFVLEYKEKNKTEIRLFDPPKLKEESFISALKELDADLFIVVAFRMLPKEVWSIPKKGTFNAHASLLPKYRGAAPINHAIMNGEKMTGVTTFLIDEEIDTGKILLTKRAWINEATADELHDKLMGIAADLVVKTIDGLMKGIIIPRVQKITPKIKENLKTANKLFPKDTLIPWHLEKDIVYNLIRGLSSYPGARTYLISGKEKLILKIFSSNKSEFSLKPGEIKTIKNETLFIGCKDGSIEITSLQIEGKKRLSAADFLRGFDISKWKIANQEG